MSQRTTYLNPIVASSGDPWVFKHTDGYYYFMATKAKCLELTRSRTLTYFAEGDKKVIWSPEPGAATVTICGRRKFIIWTTNGTFTTLRMTEEATIHDGFACWRMKRQTRWKGSGYGEVLCRHLSQGWMEQ